MQEVLSPKMQAFAGLRGGEEAIRYSLYHAKDFAAGALLGPYSFFNVPVGAQDPDTGVAATAEDTNMDAASLLTAPNRFMVVKICVPIGPSTLTLIPVGSAADGATESFKDDVTRLTWRGLFTFRLLNKEYLRLAPLGLLGAGMGVWGAVSAAPTAAETKASETAVAETPEAAAAEAKPKAPRKAATKPRTKKTDKGEAKPKAARKRKPSSKKAEE